VTEIKKERAGSVYIADEVVAAIAGTAALEAEGVAGIAGLYSGEASNKAIRRVMSKHIDIQVTEQLVAVNLTITARMGAKIHEMSNEVQERVKIAIETMTGLTVQEVNINVAKVITEKRKP